MADIHTSTTTEGATGKARELIGQAGETLKHEAQSFVDVAQQRARAEASKGAETAGKTLGDFANAVRKAGDELAQSDQSPASQLVKQAADGLEDLSRNLAGKSPEDLLDAVRDFGRQRPIAFIGGAVLVGLALGRFVRAAESGASPPRLSGESLTFAEEDAFDGPAELGSGGLGAPIADDLGDLTASSAIDTTSPVSVDDTIDDGTSGIGEPTDGSLGRGR